MGGKKGSSSKLVATLPTTLIPSSPSILKSDDVESIPFHCLRETITVSNDDSTPSTTSASYLCWCAQLGRAKCSIRALSYIRQYGAFDVSYERTLLSYGKNSNGRIYRPLAKLHSLHGTSNETIEAIMCLKDYMVMQMTEVVWHFLYMSHHTFHLTLFSSLLLLGSLLQIVAKVQNLMR